jgi:hypothetical protein
MFWLSIESFDSDVLVVRLLTKTAIRMTRLNEDVFRTIFVPQQRREKPCQAYHKPSVMNVP